MPRQCDCFARAGQDGVEFRAVDHATVGANQQLGRHLRESLDRLDVLVNNVGRVFDTRRNRRRLRSNARALFRGTRGADRRYSRSSRRARLRES